MSHGPVKPEIMKEALLEAEDGPAKPESCSDCGKGVDVLSCHMLCEECEAAYECSTCNGPDWWHDYVSGKLG